VKERACAASWRTPFASQGRNSGATCAKMGESRIPNGPRPHARTSPPPQEEEKMPLKVPRVALVTGGMGGLGEAICIKLAALGYKVVTTHSPGNTKAQEWLEGMNKMGYGFRAYACDVADWDSCVACAQKVVAEVGPIDVLVNNAGIETIVPFLDLTDEQWTRLTDTNLRGGWLCSQVYCRHVVAGKRTGNVVNIGSIQAAKVLPGRTHYAPTKLGLEALTRNMSAEMTPLGIRVNCVHPGLIDTDMTAWVMKSPEILPLVLAQISLGRAGQPREIGHVVAFFASDEASYLTGQSIHVDGGWAGK
jgi:glucose 1-dehydrogenase/3-oxoacyl-[acyl-carrier protein] reductase